MHIYINVTNCTTFSFKQYSTASVVKNPLAQAGDAGSVSGSGRSPGEGKGNILQYFCLGNPVDGGAGGLQSMESQKS